jgi:hypothetical protein
MPVFVPCDDRAIKASKLKGAMKKFLISILIFCTPVMADSGAAADRASSVAGFPAYPSVEDNLQAMDKDRNGMVTASEVRAYLESKHGKGYEKAILDRMQASEGGASCGTPFAQSFY